jgi:hypothetical protein
MSIIVSDFDHPVNRLEKEIEASDDPALHMKYRTAKLMFWLSEFFLSDLIAFVYDDYDEGVAELNKYLELRKQFDPPVPVA